MSEGESLRVWLSRSEPGASRQGSALRSAGYEVRVAPVLEIEPIIVAEASQDADVVIFLSEHAVRCVRDLVFYQRSRVYAIGARTAAVLASEGVQATAAEPATTEGLLALPEFAEITGCRVVLVTGEGGRELLYQALHSRGAQVDRHICYRRVAVENLSLQAAEIDTIVAASGDGIRLVAKVWFAANGPADIPTLVPSQRVALVAEEVGFTHVVRCSGASSQAWLEALAQLRERC